MNTIETIKLLELSSLEAATIMAGKMTAILLPEKSNIEKGDIVCCIEPSYIMMNVIKNSSSPFGYSPTEPTLPLEYCYAADDILNKKEEPTSLLSHTEATTKNSAFYATTTRINQIIGIRIFIRIIDTTEKKFIETLPKSDLDRDFINLGHHHSAKIYNHEKITAMDSFYWSASRIADSLFDIENKEDIYSNLNTTTEKHLLKINPKVKMATFKSYTR